MISFINDGHYLYLVNNGEICNESAYPNILFNHIFATYPKTKRKLKQDIVDFLASIADLPEDDVVQYFDGQNVHASALPALITYFCDVTFGDTEL